MSSCNYELEEYAHAVVSSVQMVCKEVGTPCPHIVTESGRYVTAHHSCLITEVMDVIFGLDPQWYAGTLFVLTYLMIMSERVNRAIVSAVYRVSISASTLI